jgi:hypothetical protein
MTTLVNIRALGLKDGEPLPSGHIYIGRAGKGHDGYFGNPPENGDIRFMDRITIVNNYRRYFHNRIQSDPEFKRRIEALKDQVLVCFCAPLLCHGMVIIEYLEGTSVDEQVRLHREADTERKRVKAAARKRPARQIEDPPDLFD